MDAVVMVEAGWRSFGLIAERVACGGGLVTSSIAATTQSVVNELWLLSSVRACVLYLGRRCGVENEVEKG